MTEPDEPKLRYNCFLLREDLPDLSHALRPKYRPDGADPMTKLAPSGPAPDGTIAFVGTTEPRTPKWAENLGQVFPELSDLTNRANRVVMILPVRDRFVAVCYGYGSAALEWDAVEPNFGLRVAARRFRADRVSEIRSRRIDATARTQSSSVPSGSTIDALGVDPDGEFIRKLVGEVEGSGLHDTLTGAVMASDSIAFKAALDLGTVVEHLAGMLDDLSKPAQADFSFINALEPLRNKQTVVTELESLLAAEILENAAPPTDLVGVVRHYLDFAPPDDIRMDEVEYFTISSRGKEEVFHDATLAGLRSALSAIGVTRGKGFLRNTRVMAHGADGDPKSAYLSILYWIVYETGTTDDRYVLTLGHWFKIAEAYTRQLDADLAAIRDVTQELDLPPWPKGTPEGTYNEEAANGNADLVLMDMVYPAASTVGKVEPCDLFHKSGALIHGKLYTGSQTLSHLFGQGAVSAELLRGDDAYKANFIAKVAERDAALGPVAERAPEQVTFAIGMPATRDLPQSLPIFSKVNLRNHAKRIKNTGAEPTIARIEIR